MTLGIALVFYLASSCIAMDQNGNDVSLRPTFKSVKALVQVAQLPPGSACIKDMDCLASLKCYLGKCQKYWEAPDFKDGIFSSKWTPKTSAFGKSNLALSADPAGLNATVLKVKYPAGSYNPGSGSVVGGFGIYTSPIDLFNATNVTMEFQVYFPSGFNWVLGGKLPGIYGGGTGCSGGASATNCFSTRYMWRTGGAGEIYLYADKAAQVSNFCTLLPNIICNPVYGWSLGRGNFYFKAGQWTKVRQTITLNTFDSTGKAVPNGVVSVFVNDATKPLLYLNKIVYRIKPSIGVDGMMIDTFFGGSDPTYMSPTTQYTYFKGFKYAGY